MNHHGSTGCKWLGKARPGHPFLSSKKWGAHPFPHLWSKPHWKQGGRSWFPLQPRGTAQRQAGLQPPLPKGKSLLQSCPHPTLARAEPEELLSSHVAQVPFHLLLAGAAP